MQNLKPDNFKAMENNNLLL